jgi:hypothetical protein
MSIIETDKVEVEVQEQTDPDAGCKYLVLVSYQGPNESKEIAKVLMTNTAPFIKQTIDQGNIVEDKVMHQETAKTPELHDYIHNKNIDVKNN